LDVQSWSNSELDEHVELVWNYLACAEPARSTDALFVFGGLDLGIPRHAASLYHDNDYRYVIISGASGPLSEGVFEKSEASAFAQTMVASGVPASKILLEENARNTGQNVEFGMKVAAAAGAQINSVSIVCKPFLARRALLTFKMQFPGLETVPCPPPGEASCHIDRPMSEFVARLIGELERLGKYTSEGYISPAIIPAEVQAQSSQLEKCLSE